MLLGMGMGMDVGEWLTNAFEAKSGVPERYVSRCVWNESSYITAFLFELFKHTSEIGTECI